MAGIVPNETMHIAQIAQQVGVYELQRHQGLLRSYRIAQWIIAYVAEKELRTK